MLHSGGEAQERKSRGEAAMRAATVTREELVYARAADELELAGVLIEPVGTTVQPISVVWIHGNAAAFYDRPYIALGRALAGLGVRFISGNTRGHDIASMQWRPSGDLPVTGGGGAGWERFEEAP